MTLMSVCIHCHLKLYARVMAVKLEEVAQNFYDHHMSCLEFVISRLAL